MTRSIFEAIVAIGGVVVAAYIVYAGFSTIRTLLKSRTDDSPAHS
jgi:divalent metal cation (Fe/Co/Zn/Cd) transporter